jgi:hypothetical protein
MASTTYDVSLTADGRGGYELYDARVFKGSVDVALNFNFIPATAQVIKMKLFVDGRQPQLFQGATIPKTFAFTLNPPTDEYMNLTQIQATVIYDNFESLDIIMPIYIAQPSYYSDFEGLRVMNAQFIDTAATGDVFVVLQANGNIHHMLIHANEITTPTITAADVSILVAVSSVSGVELSATPPIETSLNEIIEVVT